MKKGETKQVIENSEPEEKGTLKTARRLHDRSKVKTSSLRPVSVYKEFVVDDVSGKGGLFIWYTTESGTEVGRKSQTRTNEHTMEIIEEGYEYTIPYSKKKAEEILKNRGGMTKFYKKDGEPPQTLEHPETEF